MTRGVREDKKARERRMTRAAHKVVKYMMDVISRKPPKIRTYFSKADLIEQAGIKDHEWRSLRDRLDQMPTISFCFKSGPGHGWFLGEKGDQWWRDNHQQTILKGQAQSINQTREHFQSTGQLEAVSASLRRNNVDRDTTEKVIGAIELLNGKVREDVAQALLQPPAD